MQVCIEKFSLTRQLQKNKKTIVMLPGGSGLNCAQLSERELSNTFHSWNLMTLKICSIVFEELHQSTYDVLDQPLAVQQTDLLFLHLVAQ